MSLAPEIVCVAGGFRHNAGLLDKCIANLSEEEWKACPVEASNSLLWIAGHIVWARSRVLSTLGVSWSQPWLALFARGSKPTEAGGSPAAGDVLEAWGEVRSTLDTALESATSEALAAPWTEKAPSFDGKLSGFLSFMAVHESYHVGQATYLRRWLGRDATSR